MEQSSLSRLAGVLVSPEKTFASIREKPTWLVALAVLVIVGITGGVLMSGKIDWVEVTREALEARSQQLPEDQMERAIDVQEKLGPIMMLVVPLLFMPLGFLLTALVLLVLFKMLGGDLDFSKSFSTLLHSLMPRAVMGLLSIPVILGKDEFSMEELQTGSVLTSNLALFAPEDAGPSLLALMASFDIFSIWALVLLIIGYSTVAKVSKTTAASGVLGLWIIYVLGKVGLASLGG